MIDKISLIKNDLFRAHSFEGHFVDEFKYRKFVHCFKQGQFRQEAKNFLRVTLRSVNHPSCWVCTDCSIRTREARNINTRIFNVRVAKKALICSIKYSYNYELTLQYASSTLGIFLGTMYGTKFGHGYLCKESPLASPRENR